MCFVLCISIQKQSQWWLCLHCSFHSFRYFEQNFWWGCKQNMNGNFLECLQCKHSSADVELRQSVIYSRQLLPVLHFVRLLTNIYEAYERTFFVCVVLDIIVWRKLWRNWRIECARSFCMCTHLLWTNKCGA